MIRILHAADFHLDSPFSSLAPAQAAQRRREQRQALEQLAALCNENHCDLLLLSGDLFDSKRVYRDTLEALLQFFTACRAEIFIAPGNHDYLAPGSPYLTETFPDNVHIFSSPRVECVNLPQCNVYGAAFSSAQCAPLLRGFRVDDPSAVNLMVLHGDALQPNSPYNPISREEIAASGLSYLALGHVHAMDVQEAGGTTYAYPGCLMGRGFDETGQKGALLAELSEGDCKITVLPVASRRYEILSVEAGDDPLGMILSRLPAQTQRDCYRIILTGESDPIDTGALARDLEGRFFSLSLRDKTLPKQALWDACGEETLRGHFLQTLKEQYDHAQPEEQKLLAQAAHFGLALMDRREVQL